MITETTDGKTKKVILEYDSNKYKLVKSKTILGGYTLSLVRKYHRCSCCNTKITSENWGKHLLKKEYRDRRRAVIYKEDQKELVCNYCADPLVRKTMEALGYCNRK